MGAPDINLLWPSRIITNNGAKPYLYSRIYQGLFSKIIHSITTLSTPAEGLAASHEFILEFPVYSVGPLVPPAGILRRNSLRVARQTRCLGEGRLVGPHL